jgi:hypothetical protein
MLSFCLVLSTLFVAFPVSQGKEYLKTFEADDTFIKIPDINIADSVVSYENKEDSYQFNITLTKPPLTNVFNVPMETKGLNFYYQPPLNEELDPKQYEFLNATHAIGKTETVHRPLDVVGSYAVYKTNIKSGETGKLYHIYRPLIIDAKGKTIWGNLEVSKESLTITIDQNFLDNAVYPVVIDPSFGYTSIGGTNAGGYDGTYGVKTLFTTSEAGTLNTITCYVFTTGGVTIDLGFYSENTLLTRASQTPVSTGWFTSDPADQSVTGSIEYGLAFKTIGATSMTYAYDTGDTDQCQRNFGLTAGDNLPATFTVSNQVNRVWSIYANYTASAASPETLTLNLDTPDNDSTITTYTQSMNYTPTLIGSDSFSNATLYVNGTAAAYNQTAIQNATLNSINYVFPGANATYLWDIQVWNSTHAVFSSNGNFTLTVAVAEGGGLTDDDLIVYTLVASLVVGVTVGCIVYVLRGKEKKP